MGGQQIMPTHSQAASSACGHALHHSTPSNQRNPALPTNLRNLHARHREASQHIALQPGSVIGADPPRKRHKESQPVQRAERAPPVLQPAQSIGLPQFKDGAGRREWLGARAAAPGIERTAWFGPLLPALLTAAWCGPTIARPG